MKFKHLPFIVFAVFSITGFSQCIEITTDPSQDIFCPGDELTLTATPGYDSYTWYYNFQNSTEDGNFYETGDNSITLNAAEWAVSYWYVTVEDAACTDPSPTVVWDSWIFAPIAIAHDFPTAFCPGDSSLIENAFNGPENFQWFMDFAPIPEANESSYWVTEPGYYTLQASYPQCPDYWLNSGLGPEFSLYSPQVPEISIEVIDGISQLFTEGISDIQWYFGDEPIEDATETVLIPEEDGIYSVTGIDNNGCEVESDPYDFTSLGTGDVDAQEIAMIYPNPARDQVSIHLKDNSIKAVRIYDTAGKLIFTPVLNASEELVRFNIDQLSPGSYLIRITTQSDENASSHILVTE
ncbi:MAG TPA: T9SS type A sorting domain-containing protein [Cryomorphaceae bacterium]|nr:T9SS type A sorting domain-containing protein [Cryomorphaceae bacterium]